MAKPLLREKGIQILILGDVNVDTLLVPLEEKNRGPEWWRHRRRGGAWLLTEMIEAALTADEFEAARKDWPNKIIVNTYDHHDNGVADDHLRSAPDGQHKSSAAILRLFPKVAKGLPGDKDLVYRIERLLGFVHNSIEGENQTPNPYRVAAERCLKRSYTENGGRGLLGPSESRKSTGSPESLPQLQSDGGEQKGTVLRPGKQDIIVLHDEAAYFRDLDEEDLEKELNDSFEKDKTWIIWQMYHPLAKGILWSLFEKHRDWLKRTILVVKVECLRLAGANLPDHISLEQESENFEESIKNAGTAKGDLPLKRLIKAAHLVVDFHRQGALHYSSQKGYLDTSCYYCPYVKDQSSSPELGSMVGFTSILVAAIVRGLSWSLIHCRPEPEMSKGIIEGIKQGIVLDHLHFLHGYSDKASLKPNEPPTPYEKLFGKFAALAKEAAQRATDGKKGSWNDFRMAAVLRPCDPKASTWSRIQRFIDERVEKVITQDREALKKAISDPDITPEERKEREKRNEDYEKAGVQETRNRVVQDIGQDIVRLGLEKAIDRYLQPNDEEGTPGTPPHDVLCPFEVHGKIQTAFRDEIDGFANIRLIIAKYLADESWETPLSIAVFGQPGSGKSFTIKQILESVDPDLVKRPLVYNLAQFDEDPEELATVFHKVRDEAVVGEVPFAFFDEFDAKKLYWLKYFLAPMQDGEFKAGESTYRIGRAIFVFAGGSSFSWEEFYEDRKREQGKWERFKGAKGSDFVSRLRGHLNIQTINPPETDEGVSEILMFRRAVLLRSLLKHHLKIVFDKNTDEARIDPGVVRAFPFTG